jgi:catalase (peroxidase I)
MGMNDRETVALNGGGHAFGKVHGNSAEGKTFTSGFEGPWTHAVNQWDNEYFNLVVYGNWTIHTNPFNTNEDSPQQWQSAQNPGLMMLTSDVAMGPMGKDESYMAISEEYAADLPALTQAFGDAWYKLMSRDMGPVSRCKGALTPPAMPFQLPLPAATAQAKQVDVAAVQAAIKVELAKDSANAGHLIQLGWTCANTFRVHDYQGGCNGAWLFQEPMLSWPSNAGNAARRLVLVPVKAAFPDMSWADLVVLGAQTAIEAEVGADTSMTFCGGRTDANAPNLEQAGILAQLIPRTWADNKELTASELGARLDLSPADLSAITGVTEGGRKADAAFAAAWSKLIIKDRYEACGNEEVAVAAEGVAATEKFEVKASPAAFVAPSLLSMLAAVVLI